MSMTVDTVRYMTGTSQNAHASAVEKQDQKDTEAKAGKTQQSNVSASYDQVSLGEDGITINQTSRLQGTGQGQRQPSLPRTDTLEISEEGRAACAQQADTVSAEQYEYEAEDLSEYTDSELRQMYYSGKITRQEYMDETGETLA